MMVRWERVTK